jgi:hypothetical protein
VRFFAAVILVLAACSPAPPAVVGWQDSGAHLVDGRWIATETPCAAANDRLECRIVVERALSTVPGSVAASVTKTARAALPYKFVTPSGDVRVGHVGGGIETGQVIVLDLADGTRRVVGLVCYLPYSGDGSRLMVSMVTCRPDALDDWRDGNVPRYPEGAVFG